MFALYFLHEIQIFSGFDIVQYFEKKIAAGVIEGIRILL